MIDIPEYCLRAPSGAGSAVSSGASFQAKLGAYFLSRILCSEMSNITGNSMISKVSFETRNPVDDINVVTEDGRHHYIQAKAAVGFSTKTTSTFADVMSQFANQYRASDMSCTALLLVVGWNCSNTVTKVAKKALSAFRHSSYDDFRRSQNREIIDCLNRMLDLVTATQQAFDPAWSRSTSEDFLKHIQIHPVTIDDDGDPMEFEIKNSLKKANFEAPALFFDKLIRDCLSYATDRLSLTAQRVLSIYRPYVQADLPALAESMPYMDLPIGGDTFFCFAVATGNDVGRRPVVFRLYRFDEDGNRNYHVLEDNRLTFENGDQYDIVIRAGSVEAFKDLIHDRGIVFPDDTITISCDFDGGACERTYWAQAYRRRLNQASRARPKWECLRCCEQSNSIGCRLVETEEEVPRVGSCHMECLLPSDRVLGKADFGLFKDRPELNGLDIHRWIKIAAKGQTLTAAVRQYQAQGAEIIIPWTNNLSRSSHRNYVITVRSDSGLKAVFRRNGFADRLSRSEAEQLADAFRHNLARHPLTIHRTTLEIRFNYNRRVAAYSDSDLLDVVSFEVERYSSRMDVNATPADAHLYAPLLYFFDVETREPAAVFDVVPVLTDPLEVKSAIDHFEAIGAALPKHEIRIIQSDDDFHRFMVGMLSKNFRVALDPVFNLNDGAPGLSSGAWIEDSGIR